MSDAGTEAPESGLGRYSPDPQDAPLVEIHLLRLPVPVFHAAREHHDGLLRECRLLALAGDVSRGDAPARLVELVRILGQQYASAVDRRDVEMEALVMTGTLSTDWVDVVPVTAGAAAEALRELMDEADEYCRRSLLVTVPRPPLIRRFGEWYTGQFSDQAAGHPPTPWDGPLHYEPDGGGEPAAT